VKPRGAHRLDGISAGGGLREDDMIFINANKPIHQADEIRQEQVQRRDEQRLFGEFGMKRDRNHFRD